MGAMERPPADPAKQLAAWTEWETGEELPGRMLSNLKTGGLRVVLDHLAADPPTGGTGEADVTTLLEAWMEWETGTTAPQPVALRLAGAGLRPLLESLVDPAATAPAG